MAREEKAIFTNLCMIYDHHGNILVQDRKSSDWRGICFPGGHVEPGEAFQDAVIREVFEETGLTIEAPRLCGVKQFQTENNARYVVLLYKTDRFSGQLRSSDEGEVFWIARDQLDQFPAVADFEALISVFENDLIHEFIYLQKDGNWIPKIL